MYKRQAKDKAREAASVDNRRDVTLRAMEALLDVNKSEDEAALAARREERIREADGEAAAKLAAAAKAEAAAANVKARVAAAKGSS